MMGMVFLISIKLSIVTTKQTGFWKFQKPVRKIIEVNPLTAKLLFEPVL
jgi:hypothetical protein